MGRSMGLALVSGSSRGTVLPAAGQRDWRPLQERRYSCFLEYS
jgi:hypothetical protein